MDKVSLRRATQERHDAIVALLREGVESVETLAARVGVSPSTVRRDLTRLAQAERIARTYGGALVRDSFHERSFQESEQLHRQAKAAIAAAAAAELPAGASVFLDAGTTCLALARVLSDRGPRMVYTRGLECALFLSRIPDIEVVLLGGAIQKLSHGLVGPLSILSLDRVSYDVAFLGADAVDPSRGLGEPTAEETLVKERAASRATRVYMLVDASKLGPAAVPAWIPFEPAWTLVTDSSVTGEVLDALARSGMRVITAS
jgi:DeoR/GlpR family transcriptional regulator of sugar metabolism